MRSQIKSLFRLVVIAILNVSVLAGGVYLPSRYFTRSQLMKHQETYSPSRSRRLSKFCSAKDETATFLVSRSRKTRGDDTNEEQDEEMAPAERKFEDLSYSDLGPVGKTVAGVTEIVFATAFDFCSGYLQGFLFGTLFGSPGFIFRPVTKGVRQPFRTELSGRFARMNARSTSWAKTLGTFSAAFGGFGVAVKVLRNGEQDAWSDILSTAAAGAFFGRKEGPAGMIKGALLYGGMIYLTSGSRRGQIQDYTEKPAAEF